MAQDFQSIDSLYDFLYLDRSRLSAFMAQVFDDGVLTSVKKTEQTADGIHNGVEAGIPKLLKGASSAQSTNTTSQEMQFDSSWTLPLNVLDGLDQYGFIRRGLTDSRIGQLRLTCGKVSVLDIKLLQNMWTPLLDFFIKQEAAGKSAKQIGALKAEYKSIGALIDKLPQSVQMYLTDHDGDQVWMTLSSEFMVINPDDLALKHGGHISGDWYVLGCVDALPEDDSPPPDIGSALASSMVEMLNAVRLAAGRPSNHYGMTPILIFRRIEKS